MKMLGMSACFKAFTTLAILLLVSCFASAGDIIQINAGNRHLVPKGKEVDAIDGDYLIRNDQVIAVIAGAAPDREANQMVQGIQGAVLDFTSLAANNDQLVAYYPQGYRLDGISAGKIEILKSSGDEVTLKATRYPTAKEPYQSETEYTLRQGERFLRIKTTHTNTGKTACSFYLADKIRLDNDIADISPKGKNNLAFIYNKWFAAAYGIYRPAGQVAIPGLPAKKSLNAVGVWAEFHDFKVNAADSLTTLKPGQQIALTRYLIYGRDVAELKSISAGKNTAATAKITITDSRNKPVPAAFIDIWDQEKNKVAFAITDAAGMAAIPLEPGAFQYTAAKIGHDTIKSDFTVAQQPVALAGKMKPLTSIVFTIREAGTGQFVPVKLEFRGKDKTPDPFLGPQKRAEGASSIYYAINQQAFPVALPPGSYTVTISRGPEYQAITRQLQLRRGETKNEAATLQRAFTTPNWIISDFHNHTTGSGDSGAEIRGRLINMAASGIEFAPATEHNRISSFSDRIKEYKLEKFLASAAGIELSGRPGPGDINHQISFPLTVQAGKQGNGAPKTDADPYVQMGRLFAYDAGKVKLMQQNHPNVGWLYFDKDRDGNVDAGFGTRQFSDVMEIQGEMFKILDMTADTVKNKNSRVFHWLQMLNQGDRIYGTATSDNHVVGPMTGAFFSYVYTKDDQPATADAEDIAGHAKKGHIVMSSGPFIKADINGSMPGDELKGSRDTPFILRLEVFGAQQSRVDRVQVLVNGRQDKTLNFTRQSHPQLFTGDAGQFKHSVPLKLNKDAHVIVVAAGAAAAKGKGKVSPPFAVANPIFIDHDGNGFEANKDLLGQPLPTAKVVPGAGKGGGGED